ncbi:MAG: class I SAM-dependent methyltransferase [Lysobacterales bacterium]|nr:class I SAM-dependent methyltransferase [Rhodanobacteraceae bacterium]
MSGNEQRRDSWSRYWQGGALHSCAGSFEGNYGDSIGAFWRSVFEPLKATDRVLDIATGNGALPRLLLDTRTTALGMPEVDAIDLAAIDPPWLRGCDTGVRERLRFHADIAAESLPFADASFDLVISQYGLEYSDLSLSVHELLRVLKPGASVALIVHHADSLPVRLGRAERVEIDGLLQSGGLIQRARRLLPFLARLGTPEGAASVQRDPEAAKARQRYNEAMRELQQRASGLAGDFLGETQQALGQIVAATPVIGQRAAETQLQALVEHLNQSRLRQAELVAHALSADRLQSLGQQLAQRDGLALEIAEIRVREELFGWSLRAGAQ